LTHLVFGYHFDQQIPINVLPDGLTHLVFGYHFDRQIPINVLPESLRNLRFGVLFNQKLIGYLPKKLEILGLSLHYGFHADDFVDKDSGIYVCMNSMTVIN
jgi:hypothetical protein